MNKIESFFTNQFKFILVVLAIVKLWLVMGVSFVAQYAPHDSLLFINLANSFLGFLKGEQVSWLGTYSQLTLAKGPIYPLFLVANFLIGLPLLFPHNLLYIASGFMLVFSLKNIVKKTSILIMLYIIYIFSLETLSITIIAMRESVYPAFSVFVIVGLIGCYTHRESLNQKLALWGIFLGIALSVFWMTREEGIWIIPSFLLVESYVLFLLYKRFSVSIEFWKKVFFSLLLPLSILLGSVHLVSFVNKTYYGIYTVVEFKSPNFLSAYGTLSRVKHPPSTSRYLPVPKEVRKAIYAVSPTFKELESFLEGPLQAWKSHGCGVYPPCDDIIGGLFVWAFRDAVAMAGYYKSGEMADAFYSKMAQEINAACDKELLDCLSPRSTMAPPFYADYILPLAETFISHLSWLINSNNFRGVNLSSKSSGSDETITIFQDITRDNVAPLEPIVPMLSASGWAFSYEEKISLRVQSSTDAKEYPVIIHKTGGQDVYDAFIKNNPSYKQQYENARSSRFIANTPCLKNCSLVFYTEKGVTLASVDLENLNNKKILSTDIPFYFHIDSVTPPPLQKSSLNQQPPLPMQSWLNIHKFNLLSNIAYIYHSIVPLLAYLAFCLYLIISVINVMYRQINFLFVLNTAIFIAIIFRLLILSYIQIVSFPTGESRFFAPLYPLVLMFIMLVLVDTTTVLNKLVTRFGNSNPS